MTTCKMIMVLDVLGRVRIPACSGDKRSGPIVGGHAAWYRGPIGIPSGLTKSTAHAPG